MKETGEQHIVFHHFSKQSDHSGEEISIFSMPSVYEEEEIGVFSPKF